MNNIVKISLLVFVLILILLTTGCASVVRGTTDALVVDSIPQQTMVKVYRKDAAFKKDEISKNMDSSASKEILARYKKGEKDFYGPLVGKTPATFVLKRKGNYEVIVEAEGYKSSTVNITHKTAGAGAAGMAGNILVGGLIGAGIDAASGATQDLVPNPVSVTLIKQDQDQVLIEVQVPESLDPQ